MKRRDILRIGVFSALTAALVCLIIVLIPEKSGIRIPVHCADGSMGYIDDSGRIVLAAEWQQATPFTPEGVCYVTSKLRSRKLDFHFSGFIPKFLNHFTTNERQWKMDRLGNRSTHIVYQVSDRYPPKDRPMAPDSHGMSMIRDARGVRWITADGRDAFAGSWEDGLNFKNDDPAAVYRNGRWSFINRKGEPVTPLEWDETHGFDGKGRACVSINHKWGVINTKGDLVVPLYFNYLSGFDEKGMCAAALESGSGFIDPVGKILIPFRHVQAASFDRFDMARVVIRTENDELRVGWIDRMGKTEIPCIYHDDFPEWQWRFRDHELLTVCDHKGFSLIDRKGSVVARSFGAILAHVEDPIAPGRFWITRIPDENLSRPNTGAFHPACYDQNGKLVWQGGAWTRKQTATWLALLFGVISSALWIVMKRQRARLSTD